MRHAGQALPAPERLLLLRRERLAPPLLPERAPRAKAEVEIVEDLGRLDRSPRSECRACPGRGYAPPPRLRPARGQRRGVRDRARPRGAGRATEPELIVASGDLTHRGRREQHERAAALPARLRPAAPRDPRQPRHPVHLPGPLHAARGASSSAHGRRPQPVYRSDALFVVGLNSVRAWRQQSGGIRRTSSSGRPRSSRRRRDGALRVVTLHHHLLGAPWRSRKKPVARRNHVLAALVESGAELILAGHIHQAAISERREFEVSAAASAP